MSLQATIESFFRDQVRLPPRTTVLVAFSGGPDSTALLHALSRKAAALECGVCAAHLDHALDPDSSERRRRAQRFAEDLGVRFTASRYPVAESRRRGESPEAAARRIRYGFLAETATELGADVIATAHHADDQIETVLLRLLGGTGLRGLAAIPPIRGRIVRPLLEVRRRTIEEYLELRALPSVDDPANRDLGSPRNRIRLQVAPRLRHEDPLLDSRLLALAGWARRATTSLDHRLALLLSIRRTGDAVTCDLEPLLRWPPALRQAGLGALCSRAGILAPSRAAAAEVSRQLSRLGRVACDLGAGWRLDSDETRARLSRSQPPPAPFAYTLTVPGEIRIAELSQSFRLVRQPVAPWMFRGSVRRAGLALDLDEGEEVTVRSRRPGDRVRPFGCSYSRRLKEVLIDRKVPRSERDRLPLLCVSGAVVWVPGVTIDDRARLTAGMQSAWVAEIEPAT